MGHSIAMSAGAKNVSELRATILSSAAHITQPTDEDKFVRLAHLRQLRDCEQVAAICYRVRDGEIEFLLVRTRASRRWTFPKGSAEPGLTHAQAAALEAFEEAGVHGRIEEAPFARYVRRKRADGRKSASAEKQIAVNAHLCEVSRLSAPKESKRDRTWFSADDAKQRLREGRESRDGSHFARVVDKAVARIQSMNDETGESVIRKERAQQRQQRPRWNSAQTDPLHKVHFDFAEAYGRNAAFMPYIRRQLNETRQSGLTADDSRISRSEVLEFQPSRAQRSPRWLADRNKIKALGSGI